MSEEDDRLRDEAAAWVLGALDDDGGRARSSAAWRRRAAVRKEVGELQEAADALPFAVPPVGPPPELRDRIMAVVESEAELLHATGARADRPYRAARTPWLAVAAASAARRGAACVLLLAGVAAGLLIGGGGCRVGAHGRRAGHRRRHRERVGAGRDRRRQRGARRRRHAVRRAPAASTRCGTSSDGQTDPVAAGALFDVDSDGQRAVDVPGDVEDVDDRAGQRWSRAGGSEEPTHAAGHRRRT